MKKTFTLLFVACGVAGTTMAQDIQNNPGSNHGNKFEQLGTILPTPNEQRTASGAPGDKYWQQRADYDIKCQLDEKNLKLTGSETITYYNNSPDPLDYLWMQLDENQHSNINNANYQNNTTMPKVATTTALERAVTSTDDNGYGDKILSITDAMGKPVSYTINKTMMRLDMPAPLKPGGQYVFHVKWYYKISDRMSMGGRGGYEYFPGDGNYLFTMTQWYPRMCVYSDFQGWQNHQFTGRGEFALTFGNFHVAMTVPADHIVGGTGECQNYAAVLSAKELARYNQAKNSAVPVQMVTLDEAKYKESHPSKATKTWVFQANNVRDFAWTSSRKFIWDGMGQAVEGAAGRKVMCMSYYGKEAYGLYSKYSTKLVAHTVKTYSHFTFPFPYPVAQSVEASNGMEYPMICFNYGRTEKDGTYSESTKNGMIGVIIHEVGHNFFPMIVNSDERQWTWMDEGINSFLEYLTEELWDNKYPSKKGAAYTQVDYMKLPKDELEPIMTNSEDIVRFGPNAYTKPATALNILRETIMGRQLFDFAFKEYARRWEFKHPTPADFFRTMEDASGENLDWFWRGWFYSTDPCDISLDSVRVAKADMNGNLPAQFNRRSAAAPKVAPPAVNSYDDISKIRNREDKSIQFYTDRDTSVRDFYWKYDRGLASVDSSKFRDYTNAKMGGPMTPESLTDEEKAKFANKYFYQLNFSNKGGLVMPIIVQFTYTDGTKSIDRIPAQIWRLNEKHVSKFYVQDKEVASIQLDPFRETCDIDESNNYWGKMPEPSKFQVFKQRQAAAARGGATGVVNPMQVSGGK